MVLIKGSELKNKKLYRFLPIDMTRNGFTYKEGVNIDNLQFNPSGSCQSGGLYFFDENYSKIKNYYYENYYVVDVSVDDNEDVWMETDGKYKAHKITISNIRNKIHFTLTTQHLDEIVKSNKNNLYFDKNNLYFDFVYHMLHGKKHTLKELNNIYDYVVNIKKDNAVKYIYYLYDYIEFNDIDEDMFLMLQSLTKYFFDTMMYFFKKDYVQKCMFGKDTFNSCLLNYNKTVLKYNLWRLYIVKHLLKKSKDPIEFLKKYYNSNNTYIIFDIEFEPEFVDVYLEKDEIRELILKNISAGKCFNMSLNKLEYALIMKCKDNNTIELLVESNPLSYIFVKEKTYDNTIKFLDKIHEMKSLYLTNSVIDYVCKEYINLYEIKKKLFLLYEYYDVTELFVKEIIEHGELLELYDKLKDNDKFKKLVISKMTV